MPTEAASLSTCDSVDYHPRLAAAVAAHTESFPAIIAAHFQSAPDPSAAGRFRPSAGAKRAALRPASC